MRLTTLKEQRLADTVAEDVRRNTFDAIAELQGLCDRDVRTVELADGVPTRVPHRLGRAPKVVIAGVPRGAVSAGFIVETRDAAGLEKAVVLTANGYGATITVDVEVK